MFVCFLRDDGTVDGEYFSDLLCHCSTGEVLSKIRGIAERFLA